MANILIADSQYLEKEKFLLEPELKLVNPETSEETLLAQVEEMSPKVIAVNLATPTALKTIEFLSSKFKEIKILAVNAINNAAMIEAIEAGASGSTLRAISDQEMSLVLNAVERECILVDKSEGGEKKFLVLPSIQSRSKIKKWRYWIAIELINSWRAEPFPYQLEIDSCLVELGIKDFIPSLNKSNYGRSIDKELDLVVKGLCHGKSESQNLQKNLDEVESQLSNWYFSRNFNNESSTPKCCLDRIRANTREVKKISFTKLRGLIRLWKKGGSYTVFKWVESVILNLRNIEREFEEVRQDALVRASSAENSYRKLSNKLASTKSFEDFQSATRALRIKYQSTINAEITEAASQIIGEMVEELRAYLKTVAETDHLLYDLQNFLNECLTENSTPAFFWSDAERKLLSADLVRRDFEQWLGVPLVGWGNLPPAKRAKIKDRILAQARNLVVKFVAASY